MVKITTYISIENIRKNTNYTRTSFSGGTHASTADTLNPSENHPARGPLQQPVSSLSTRARAEGRSLVNYYNKYISQRQRIIYRLLSQDIDQISENL